jgi:class 3 adenylate cyclase
VDVIALLSRLGLEQYEQAFRENDVDAEVLGELTAEDLIDLGVTSVGHRRKLLAAIAGLREKPIPASKESSTAERRQLTVMFCDLVGSTALSTRFDPEDMREIIAAYHRTVAEIVAAADGFVSRYMGDAVLVYFGFPQAHEDDAEPATRLRHFCSPYHRDSALFPVVAGVAGWAGWAPDPPPAIKLEQLKALLAQSPPPDEDAVLLADLLSLPASERHPPPSLSPQRKKERTLEALIRQLERLARQRPVMMVFEGCTVARRVRQGRSPQT